MIIKKFTQPVASNAISLFTASYFLDGFLVEKTLYTLGIGAIVLSLVNFIVKPILKVITFPINVITLGFFGVFINAILLFITAYFVKGIEITGGTFSINALGIVVPEMQLTMIPNLILAAFVIGIINWILRKLIL